MPACIEEGRSECVLVSEECWWRGALRTDMC
jgi:hypothetical protein